MSYSVLVNMGFNLYRPAEYDWCSLKSREAATRRAFASDASVW